MMSKKRFMIIGIEKGCYRIGNVKDIRKDTGLLGSVTLSELTGESCILDMLNQLNNENEQLRQMIKENVFQQYNEGSLADLKFKAIAYDDIIKVKLSDESEPKVIVICKQGKKGNVKSFCQMFIPFGVHYEIKERDDEIGRV